MDLELSDEQRELQSSVRAVLERECPPSLVRAVIEEGKGSEDLWARMVELDWPALTIPEADGGIGLGFVELAVVAEELGRVLSPAPFLATAGQFVPALLAAGSVAQRKRFLGAVASEGLVGTVAVAEAAGSWEAADVTTTATADGDSWVLQGEKHYVFDGVRADEMVVAARLAGTSGDDGIALFVVPQSSVRARPMEDLDASRQYATVVLDRVRVEADRVLGEPGRSAAALRRATDEATAALAAEMVGTCQAIFDIVHTYVGEREQFGVKIGSFQAIKHKLANMFVALESARATTYFAALTMAEDDERRTLAVPTAKAAVGDCQKLMAQEGIQCLGGIGYTWEHDMHMYVKRVKTTQAMFGSGGVHRARVAELIGLDRAMKNIFALMPVAVYKAPGEVAVEQRPVPQPGPGQILVEVGHCGICGSDIHLMFEGWGKPGLVGGHEFTGTIKAVGDDAGAWVVGDQVVGGPSPKCGSCRRCREGKPSQCEGRKGTIDTHLDDGAFARYILVNARSLLRLPAGLSARDAALAEPLAVALHGITRSGITDQDTAMVFGAGPIGALTIVALVARGIPVTVVEPGEERRRLAAALGATEVIGPEDLETYPPWEPERLSPRAVDVVLECSGKKVAMEAGFHQLRRGGILVLVGAGIEAPAFDPNRFILNELSITGSFVYDADGFEKALALLASGVVPTALLIDPDDIGLERIGGALSDLASGRIAGKVMVVPGLSAAAEPVR